MRPAGPPIPELLRGPTATRDALALTTRGRLRGPAYRRLVHGVVTAGIPEPGLVDRVRAVLTALPTGTVLGGRTAALALGSPWFAAAREPVEVVVPPHRCVRRPGVRARREMLDPSDVVATPLGPATSPARTAFDLGRRGPLTDAVASMDAVLRVTGTEPAAVRTVAERHPGARGLRLLRDALRLTDPRAESPRESLLRVTLALAGIPAPVPQFAVHDADGHFVARLDLAWPELLAAAEYDGALHRERERHSRDLRRQNRLRALSWRVLQIDAAQMRHPALVVALVASLLGRTPE